MDQGQQKRKRGRPRKAQPPPDPQGHVQSGSDEILTPSSNTVGTSKRRGRPPKNPPVSEETRRPRTRGARARQIVPSDDDDDDEAGDGASSSAQPRERQGTVAGWIPTGRDEQRVCEAMESQYHTTLESAMQRNKKKPRMNKDSIEALSHLFYAYDHEGTGLWTDSLEAQVTEAWNRCAENTALDNVVNMGFSLSSIFKVCFDLFKIDPLSLLSFYSDFDYDNSDSDAIMHQGVSITNPLWTFTFCDRLHKLLTHPLFRSKGAYRLVPLAIKWAVIVRLDDRKGFWDDEQRMLSHVGCPDLGRGVSHRKMTERLVESQKQLSRDGLCVTPFAELLLTIGQQVAAAPTPNLDGRLGTKTADVTAVIEALDSLNSNGMTVTCQAHYHVYLASRTQRGYPSGLLELKEAYKKAWLNVRRRSICEQEIARNAESQVQLEVESNENFEIDLENESEVRSNEQFNSCFDDDPGIEPSGQIQNGSQTRTYPRHKYQVESPDGIFMGDSTSTESEDGDNGPQDEVNLTTSWQIQGEAESEQYSDQGEALPSETTRAVVPHSEPHSDLSNVEINTLPSNNKDRPGKRRALEDRQRSLSVDQDVTVLPSAATDPSTVSNGMSDYPSDAIKAIAKDGGDKFKVY